MAFKPLHDRVLVRRVKSDEKTKGGLIIPDTAKEKPAEGEIVSVGEGARKDSGELIAPSVKAGDKVLLILDGAPEAVTRSVRNLEKVKLIAADQLNVFDLLHANKLVLSEEALAKIQEVYGDV